MRYLPTLIALLITVGSTFSFTEEIGSVTTIQPDIEEETTETVCDENKVKTEERNKQIVIQMMQEVYGDKNIDAFDKYLDENNYIQHNPLVADGKEAVKKALKDLKFGELPKVKLEVQRVVAEGDLVVFHWKSTQLFGKVSSIIEIFKVENGKMVEHWDVTQFVPEKSENDHPLF